MDSKNSSNKIREIVRLKQILKKWRKSATASSKSNNNNNSCSIKSIKFLKRTLSISDSNTIPKGYLAVCVGEEQKRYVIPTEYLSHQTFHVLLREAEEEFGFQQTGVLRIPCEVSVFEKNLKIMEEDNNMMMQECRFDADDAITGYYLPDCQSITSHHPQSPMCR